MSSSSIASLERFVDRTYNDLANPPNPPKRNMADQGGQVMDDESNMSTPTHSSSQHVNKPALDSVFTPTGTVNDEKNYGFMSFFSAFSRKRKQISPVIDEYTDISEEVEKAAEMVYNMVVSDMSRWMNEQLDRFATLEADLRGKVENELMKDALDETENNDAIASDVSALQDEVKKLNEQLKVSIGRITRAEKERDDMKEEMLQIQARMMRDNLVFYNVDEQEGEMSHDCRDTLKAFLKEEMKVSNQDMSKIDFDRVHRIGKKFGNKKRPIVAKFNPTHGKKIVMDHVKNLNKNKRYGVNDQLPRELEVRKRSFQSLKKPKRTRNNQSGNLTSLSLGIA